ncbi:MAG: glycoside hydrolase family 99-like domain-containing protein, partial [Bdellovibrionales bacterium]|nr:glycoside hydrolase family 99-like domain-containing protein [Bdellovibrionales bacterium]
AGHAGDVAQPKYEPLLGRYLSDDPSVFGAHIEWAKEAGIRFFVFDWWPERRSARRRIRKNLDHAANLLNNFEFAVQYETLDLKTSERKPRPDEDFNELIMTQERAERMAKHWQHIATEYASHPAYKRIDGRPVLFVYASRHVVGDAAKYFLWAKEEVARVTGVSFYLIGDEVYFNVLDRTRKGEVILKSERTANWPRLSAFDAITCYNPYDSSRKEHSGPEGLERFIADVSDLYRYYRGVAAAGGQRFFPGIIPGYDDRGVRPKAGHYIIPRQDSTGRSLLSRLFDEWSGAHLTPENDQILITSWNEWNEGTQIEPSRDALGQSPADAPGSCGQLVEQSSYGCKYLSELRRISRKYR